MSTDMHQQQAGQLATTDVFDHALDITCAKQRYNAVVEFAKSVMTDGKDYGTVPGTVKPSLLKPGAEKLISFFGLSVEHPELLEKVEDWTGEQHGGQPFFYYMVRQDLTRNGKLIASQIGSCNSWESKYKYRWTREADVPDGLDKSKLQTRDGAINEFAFAIDKAETTGQYGKPAEYWAAFRQAIQNGTATKGERKTSRGMSATWSIGAPMYRVPNNEPFDLVNTVLKMAEKRALVAVTLVGCNASEFYTQDIEDLDLIDVPFGPTFPTATQPISATPHTVTAGATLDDLNDKHANRDDDDSDHGKPTGNGGKKPHNPQKSAQTAAGVGQNVNTASSPSKRTSSPEETRVYVLGKITEARNAANPAEGEALLAAIRAGLPKLKTLTPEARQECDQAIAEADNALAIGATLIHPQEAGGQFAHNLDELQKGDTAAAARVAEDHWTVPIMALTTLPGIADFKATMLPTITASLLPHVERLVLIHQLTIETSLAKCLIIKKEHPELADHADRRITEIKDAMAAS